MLPLVIVLGRGVLTISSKMSYWARLRALASIKFSSFFAKFSKLKGRVSGSKSGAAVNKFLSSKLGMSSTGLTASQILWMAAEYIVEDELESSKIGNSSSRLTTLSVNYMSDTFVKMLQMSLDQDETLQQRLIEWDVRIFIIAGANDKSCRVLIKPKHGEMKVISSFVVCNWIDKYKPKGDMKRFSDVLEYEYFHTFHQPKIGRNAQKEAKAYRDNILISDSIDKNMVKASVAYSALLYDLLRLSKPSHKTLDTSRLPTMKELNYKMIKAMNALQNDKFANDAMKNMNVDSLISNTHIDLSSIGRASMLKTKIFDSVANTDFHDAAILFLLDFMKTYADKRHVLLLPTKFNSKEFNSKGVRKADGYHALLIQEVSDLDDLGELLIDGRSKISRSPGMIEKKLAEFKKFSKISVNNIKLAKKAADGQLDALDTLRNSLTSDNSGGA